MYSDQGKSSHLELAEKKWPHAKISGAGNAAPAVKIFGDPYIVAVQGGDLANL